MCGVFHIMWEILLTSLHRVSPQLQAINTDLLASDRLLSAAHGELQYLRDSWEAVGHCHEFLWGFCPEFTEKLQRRTKTFPDEFSSDCMTYRPRVLYTAFKVDVFYKLVEVAINQL